MKSKFILSILATVLLAGSAQAQYTGSNQTNTISGVTVDNGGDSYVIGQTYVDDALVIQSGGVLSSPQGFIGVEPGANDNSALVTGGGSVWSNTAGTLYVGYYGAGNSLTIASSGTVINANGYIGYQPGSSNNAVLVTGNDSAWLNGFGTNAFILYVGYGDANNSLTISNGGGVYSYQAYVGVDNGANSNIVLVTGSGSVWSNATYLFIGEDGDGNSLTIANRGAVYSGTNIYFQVQDSTYRYPSYIGDAFDSNIVLVTGSGSVWSNASDLYVGAYGEGNSLTIASSGTVYNLYGYIGVGSDNNSVLVSGSGSAWNNAYELYIGSNGVGNSLTITNGGIVNNDSGYIGYAPGADSNTVLVTGRGSLWNSWPGLIVGTYGAGNSLSVINGASVTNHGGLIGGASGADSNTVLVTGDGSVWYNDFLYVGDYSAGNSLVISNGGSVVCADDGLTIDADGGSNDTVVIAGGSLVVTNEDGNATLFVSQAGGPDSLVLDGGTVTVDYLYLPNGSNSIVTFNAGALNSGGTIVTTPQNFTVGDGTDAAVFHLLGGEHTFVYGYLEISSNAMLTGCGDINGEVQVDAGGTVLANCGGTLTFSRYVNNDGIIEVVNGSALVADDQVFNYGLIVTNGHTEFNGGLFNVNSGCVLAEQDVQISSITRSGNNIIVQIPSGSCGAYQLQVTPSLKPEAWTNLGAPQSASGGLLTFIDTGGATNRPSRFYRIDITLPEVQ